MCDDLFRNFVEMEEEEAIKIARSMLNDSDGPMKILKTCKDAMEAVGRKFEANEYFLSELLAASEIFTQIMEFTLPRLQQSEVKKLGSMVLGTVESDVHDIGKNIFKVMAEASGFEVIDLGIDVPASRFVDAVKTHQPDLLGMSCLITSGLEFMKRVADALKEAGLRERVKVIIGGGRVNDEIMKYVDADGWADDAARGVRICKELMENRGDSNG